jgi:hypothetical protein
MINEIEHIISFYIMFKIVAFVTDYFVTFILTYVFGFLLLDMIGLLKND